MKKKIFALAFLATIFSCTSKKKRQENFAQQVHYDTSIIAVIPFDTGMRLFSDSVFQNAKLTQQELLQIEELFVQSVTDHNSSLSGEEAKKSWGIDLNKGKYKRQYVCVFNGKGEKLVFINCFCGESTSIDWTRNLVSIEDGGACVFRLTVNLSKKKYYDFSINGDA